MGRSAKCSVTRALRPSLRKRRPHAKTIRVPARVAEANLVHDVAPKYPPEAGQARIEGTVVLLAVIRKDGTVGMFASKAVCRCSRRPQSKQ